MTLEEAPKTESAARSPLACGLLLSGIGLMVGGEALCFLGPESHAQFRDIVCHVIFCSGAACALAGGIYSRRGRR